MLSEFALTPDVFEVPSDSEAEMHELCMSQLRDLLINYGLVRDLWRGEWSQQVRVPERLSLKGKELLKKLYKEGRLRQVFPTRNEAEPPRTADEWIAEAKRSHDDSESDRKLKAIIVSANSAHQRKDDELIASTQSLHKQRWWNEVRSSSVRLERTTEAYLKQLSPVLLYSNSLMFIDPYLDPSQANYSEFIKLFEPLKRRESKPTVEIHRVCRKGTGHDAKVLQLNDWKSRFGDFSKKLKGLGISAMVHIWDKFHDRYLISNLIGLNLPNGFDVSKEKSETTTWTRLSRVDRDDVQKEFHRNAEKHELRCQFRIGVAAEEFE